MIHAQTDITESEFNQQQCPIPNRDDNALNRALKGSLTGIVAFIKLDNDNYHVLSRYEDDKWTFSADRATKGSTESSLTLNFSTIKNEEMKAMAKWVVWNTMKLGNAHNSLRLTLSKLKSFFAWILDSDTLPEHGLNAFTGKAYVDHVNAIKTKRKGEIKPLANTTKAQRYLALEQLYTYCKAFDFVKEHPWVDSSACEQAGHAGQAHQESLNKPKTPLIPNEVLHSLCDFTKGYLDQAKELLDLRDKLDALVVTGKDASTKATQKRKYLQSLETEFDKLQELSDALLLLRDSCIFWLLLTTGMRIHEVLGIKRKGYRTETKNDETYYYVQTISEKTHTGFADWIAPKLAIDAIDILGRYVEPLQLKLETDLAVAQANTDYQESKRLQDISGDICLSTDMRGGNKIVILSAITITECRLPNLCALIGSDWNLSAHQFRRTFANYVVHSELGDLRALKDHFKHWSITMTALYAYNDELDVELFEELLREKYWVEEQIKFDWFNLDTPITGGALADKIMEVRSSDEHIKTFDSREDMVRAYSSNIPIRSTGLGWCTNDDECTCGKPDKCDHGIVDKSHVEHWTGVLKQQMKLSEMDDIGESGKAVAALGMDRCEKTLTALGMDVDTMKIGIKNQLKKG
ncbi:MAG: site-specific integrase [Psychromonas sp.]